MNRRTFVTALAQAVVLVPLTRLVAACGSDKGSPPEPSGGDSAGGTLHAVSVGSGVTVSGNHGHTVSLSLAELESTTVDATFTLAGIHTHTFVLTAADFDVLRACGQVQVASTSTSAHTHNVTVLAC